MPETYGSVRQLPCPDCGNPVMPDRDQLCPNCGYPLMFLRKSAGDDARAQAVPRSPNPGDDATNLRVVPQPVPRPLTDTRQFPSGTYGTGRAGGAPAGQLQCRNCGYPNDQARVRCERCGYEMRPSRPRGVELAPVAYAQSPRPKSWGWLLILLILGVLAVLALAAAIVWLLMQS